MKGKKGYAWKKWQIMIMACLLIVLVGCGKGSAESSGEEKSSEKTTEESEEKVPSTDAEKEEQKAPQPTSAELYEGFLRGDVRVYCDNREYTFYDSVADEEVRFFSGKDGYVLKEFVSEIQEILDLEPDVDVRVSSVSWAMMDCGDDGEPELILEVITDGDRWGEGEDYQFVIKNVDGKLQVCYRTVTAAYRSYSYVENHYGLVFDSYSWGMGYNADYGWLDAKGEYHYLYGVNSDSAIYLYDDYGLGDALLQVAEREGDESLFESFQVLRYRLKEYEEGEDPGEVFRYSWEYYGGENYGDEPEEELMSLFREAFNVAGIKLYEMDEINKILRDRQEERGLTAEMMTEEDPEFVWTAMEKVEFWPGKVTTVKNATEFMDAIENNAYIRLEPGTYDLTQWLKSDNHFKTVGQYIYAEDYDSYNEDGVLYGGYDDDSWEIVINRIRNLVITSADPANPARIVCDCPQAVVLNFRNCSFVELKDVIMGHEIEPGYCSGDVVGIYKCRNVVVNGCDLYGCGAHAFDLTQCQDITVENCVIHDCSYGCLTAYYPGYVYIYNTVFENCKEYDMFSVYYGDIFFSECTFRNLNGNMVWLDDDSYVSFIDCQFDRRALESLQSNPRFESQIFVY